MNIHVFNHKRVDVINSISMFNKYSKLLWMTLQDKTIIVTKLHTIKYKKMAWQKKNKSINDLAITLNSNRPRPLYKYYFTCRQCLYNCSTLSSSILFNWAIMWLHIHVGVSELGVMTITSIALIAVIQLHYYHIHVYNTSVYKI